MRGEKNLNTPSLAVYTLSMVASCHTARRWVRAGPKMARGLVCVTYLPLGSMAVQTGLGSAVASALPVVDVEVEWELGHLSAKLD